MAMKTFCPQMRHRGSGEGATGSEEEEEKDGGCLQLVPRCPACKRARDVALILPCSHTMCARCVAAGGRTGSGQSPRPVCSVLCPCCRYPVELPCSAWSFATSCLPKHPALSSACLSGETGRGRGASEDQLHCVQGDTPCRDDPGPGSSSSITPVDGAVDLQEREMEQSVFGLCFSLDPSRVPPSLHLSGDSLTVAHRGPPTPPPDKMLRGSKMTLPQVCADVVIARGQYYWEVDVCNSSIYRIGVASVDGGSGWWLERRGPSFCAAYDGSREPLGGVPPQMKTLGVFLNLGGGALSFHNPLARERLATLPTRFGAAGVVPAVGLGQGRLRLRCGLPPPPHVFLSKDSSYRGPRGAGGGRWHREIPFRSVRKVIRKFEELVASDSDSGLASGLGSSCSTLASLPDLGTFPPGHAGAGNWELDKSGL